MDEVNELNEEIFQLKYEWNKSAFSYFQSFSSSEKQALPSVVPGKT